MGFHDGIEREIFLKDLPSMQKNQTKQDFYKTQNNNDLMFLGSINDMDHVLASSGEPVDNRAKKQKKIFSQQRPKQSESFIIRALKNYPLAPTKSSRRETSIQNTYQSDLKKVEFQASSRAIVLQKLLGDVEISKQLLTKFRDAIQQEKKEVLINQDKSQNEKDQRQTQQQFLNVTDNLRKIQQQKKQKQYILSQKKFVLESADKSQIKTQITEISVEKNYLQTPVKIRQVEDRFDEKGESIKIRKKCSKQRKILPRQTFTQEKPKDQGESLVNLKPVHNFNSVSELQNQSVISLGESQIFQHQIHEASMSSLVPIESFIKAEDLESFKKKEIDQIALNVYGRNIKQQRLRLLTSVLPKNRKTRQPSQMNLQVGGEELATNDNMKVQDTFLDRKLLTGFERTQTSGLENIHERAKFIQGRLDSSYSRKRLFSGRPRNMESSYNLHVSQVNFKTQNGPAAQHQIQQSCNLLDQSKFQATQVFKNQRKSDELISRANPQKIPKGKYHNRRSRIASAMIIPSYSNREVRQKSVAEYPKSIIDLRKNKKPASRKNSFETLEFAHKSYGSLHLMREIKDTKINIDSLSFKQIKKRQRSSSSSISKRYLQSTLSHLDLAKSSKKNNSLEIIQCNINQKKKKPKSEANYFTKPSHIINNPQICPGIAEEIAKQEKLGFVPKMLRIEKQVGNSNNQNLDSLKPKWVESVEIRRAKDEKGKLIPPNIVTVDGVEFNPTMLPILIAHFKYIEQNKFKRLDKIIDIKTINDSYFESELIIEPELKL